MTFDPMLYQAYQNDPQGFMENVYPLLTQNQQGQFQSIQRRDVAVKNSEGAFDRSVEGGPFGIGKDDTKGLGKDKDQGKGGARDLSQQSRGVVSEAVKQRDERKGLIDKARGGDPKGTFGPFDINIPTMPAQTTTGQAIVPTAAQTSTVTVTPGVPQTSNAQNPLTQNATDPLAGSQQERTIAGSGVELAPHQGPALAIQNPGGQEGTGWAPTNAVMANVVTNKTGQTQAISLSDFIKKQGSFNLAGYADGGMIDEPIVGQGTQTGTVYTFGEKGRERVMPEGPYRTEIKLRSGHRISVGGSD